MKLSSHIFAATFSLLANGVAAQDMAAYQEFTPPKGFTLRHDDSHDELSQPHDFVDPVASMAELDAVHTCIVETRPHLEPQLKFATAKAFYYSSVAQNQPGISEGQQVAIKTSMRFMGFVHDIRNLSNKLSSLEKIMAGIRRNEQERYHQYYVNSLSTYRLHRPSISFDCTSFIQSLTQ